MGEEDLEALIGHIPSTCPTAHKVECCCGRRDCAYLKHNCSALDDLEKEVHTAATLGQALLVRHEQYMQDAEQDRLDMTNKIEQLENDKKELEDQNAKTIEENRALLEQLEELNTTVADSEVHIKSLEATLQSTRQELRRLEGLASRTHDLEMQLTALEQEQDALQKTVARTEAEERSAIQRWKKAERRLGDLHEQLERIEREAREERERHVEVLGRMERQRTVERELDTAAGRLKAAAATTGNGKRGSNVVSHFVKDILQDNANLQMGIMELREMLMSSNDEVQALREQLMLHQPLESGESTDQPTLRAELATKQSPEPAVISQALHIHHHYHAPKKEEIRRPKKKRVSLNALFTPPKINSSPRTPRTQDTSSAILSQTSVTIPAPITPTNRWSMQSGQMSDFAPSSVPSSPVSMYRNSMLFDRSFDVDSSRPTSPGSSVDPMSPQFQPFRHRKKGSEVSTRSFAPINFQSHHVIQEEDGDVEECHDLQTPSMPSLDENTTPSETSRDSEYLDHSNEDWNPTFQPTLRRTTSHESILSISGIDIHTLKSRPSQLTIREGNALLRPRTRLGTPTSIVSVDTVVAARPTLTRMGHDSTSYLRSNMRQHNSDTRSINSSNSGEGPSSNKKSSNFSGWFVGRWGVSPSKSENQQYRSVTTPENFDPLKIAFGGRPPGINQKGPIPGFVKKVDKAPSKVTPEAVDYDALREILEGGLA